MDREQPEREHERTEVTSTNRFGTERPDSNPVAERMGPSFGESAESVVKDGHMGGVVHVPTGKQCANG